MNTTVILCSHNCGKSTEEVTRSHARGCSPQISVSNLCRYARLCDNASGLYNYIFEEIYPTKRVGGGLRSGHSQKVLA